MTEFFNVDTDPNQTLFPPVTYPNDAVPRQTYSWCRILAGGDCVFAGNVFCKGELRDKNNDEVIAGGGVASVSAGPQTAAPAYNNAVFLSIANDNLTVPDPLNVPAEVRTYEKPGGANNPQQGTDLGNLSSGLDTRLKAYLQFEVTNLSGPGFVDFQLSSQTQVHGGSAQVAVPANGLYSVSVAAFTKDGQDVDNIAALTLKWAPGITGNIRVESYYFEARQF